MQLFKITPTPDAAYEICTTYAPDCDTAIGAADAEDDNRDEEEDDEEDDEEEGEEEIEEDLFHINGTSDPLVVTHEYQRNITYVSCSPKVFEDFIMLLCYYVTLSIVCF